MPSRFGPESISCLIPHEEPNSVWERGRGIWAFAETADSSINVHDAGFFS